MKKSLIFWFAAVTCAALFLVGCESPTNGESGAAGTDGPYPLTGTTIDAEALKAAFYVSSRVAITGGSSGIDGEVPAGKTLYVLNPAAKVTSGESLTVKGTLDIYEAAALDASYTGTAGYLATSGGAITGTGIVSLPYLAAGVTDGPTGIVTYGNSPGGITKTAGSYIVVSAATPGSALNNANLITLMGVLPAGASLTVSSIEDLTAAAVPAGKTLTLTGAGNTVPVAGLNLSAAGTLIVNGTLEVASGATITGKAEAPSNITVNGTLKLATDSTVLTIAGVVDLTEATIDATAAGEATLTLPAGATAEVGKISVGDTNDLTIAGVTDTLTVGEIASAGKSVKSATVKTYAVKGGGSVGLATAADTFLVKRAGIVNGIPDTEFVLDDSSGAIPIGSALTITDAVLNAGTTNGITVTAGGAPDTYYALTTANLAQVKGKIAYAGAVTGIAETLVIPADVELDVSTAGTLATITGLTVNGDLTVKSAAVSKTLTATGTGSITISDAASFSELTTFSFPGVITFASTVGAATAGGIVFEGDVVFGGNVTLTAVPATFKKTAFFADGTALILTDVASIVNLYDTTGALAVGAPVAGVPDIYSTILKADAGANAVLTPAVKTKLTFTASGKVLTQGASETNEHGITLTSGKATLISGSSYVVESAENKKGTLTVTGTLTLGPEVLEPAGYGNEAAPKLVLTGATGENGAKLAGAGSVVAGGTTIVGGTNGWQAVDDGTDTYTIEANAITAAGAGGAFTAVTGATQPSITVAAGATLNLAADTTIDLKGTAAAVGSIVLKGAASNGAILAFAQGTTSIVKTANDGSDTSGISIANATIGANLDVKTTGSSNYYLVDITSKDQATGRTIQAGSSDVTLGGSTVAGSAA
jgi:hypothetical protein